MTDSVVPLAPRATNVRGDVILGIAAFSPVLAYYGFAVAAALYLGHWPYYAHPDPKELPLSFESVRLLIAFSQPIWLVLVLPMLIMASIRMWRAEELSQFAWATLPAVLVFATWIILRTDPNGVVDWFWD